MHRTTGAGAIAALVAVLAAGGIAVGVGVTSARPVDAATWVACGLGLIVVAAIGIAVAVQLLRRYAATDALTGLPNRSEFTRLGNRRLRRLPPRGEYAALVVVDLDRFKSINDSIGHTSGDQLLVEIAERLRRSVRDGDLVARWGGDEFVLLLLAIADPWELPARVEQLAGSLDGVGDRLDCGDGRRSVTASVGAAIAPTDGDDIEELFDVADLAMYAEKARRAARLDR